MFSYRKTGLVALLAALLLGNAVAGGAWAGERKRPPTVVELFTSQGCNSCPPADALLGELADRDDLLALTYNVHYWDYLGWPDTLGSKKNTERQQNYAVRMGRRGVYTPQMVIGGHIDAVGSNRGAVARAIARDQQRDEPVLDVYFTRKDNMVLVQITGAAYADAATIWLMRYDKRHDVPIERGENAGHKLSYFNVVRDYKSLGLWRGHAMEIALDRGDIDKDGSDGCAVLVQLNDGGTIVGAKRVTLADLGF